MRFCALKLRSWRLPTPFVAGMSSGTAGGPDENRVAAKIQGNRAKEESSSFLKKGGARPAGTKKLLLIGRAPAARARA
jgi:hypothetical protein